MINKMDSGLVTSARKALNAAGFFNPIKAQVVNSDGVITKTTFTQNGIVDEGMHALLDIMFRNQTQSAIWYMSLIDTGATLADADTMSSNSWDENLNFTAAARQNWTTALSAAATRSISNSTTIDFAFTTTQTIHGIFINDALTGTAGTLWATAPFSTEVTVNNGDTLKVTYTVSG